MELNGKQRRHLRALAHHLNPVVMVGRAGLSDAVARSVDEALAQHELLKIRVDAESPDDRDEVAEALAQRLGASCVQIIGHMVVLYRRHPEAPQVELPGVENPKAPLRETPKPKAPPRGATKRPLRKRRGREG